MIYRMKRKELDEFTGIDSLNGKIAVHYIECALCGMYKRLSYDKHLVHAAVLAHMRFEHGVTDSNDFVKNIKYNVMVMDKDLYMQLHDLVLIDP